MKELNLNPTTQPQKIIKEYLEQNASDILADKINNGVPVEKDGKTLLNKKTLDDFMKYANDEARKMAEKGANCACIEDSIVFGWAIHYFEEDSIVGKLYNEDGTEHIPKKTTPKKKADKKEQVKKTEQKPIVTENTASIKPLEQISIFDLI